MWGGIVRRNGGRMEKLEGGEMVVDVEREVMVGEEVVKEEEGGGEGEGVVGEEGIGWCKNGLDLGNKMVL